jgi:actin-related protein
MLEAASEEEEFQTIVIDNGSRTNRWGVNYMNEPLSEIPSLIDETNKDLFGDEALLRHLRNGTPVRSPFEQGIIRNFDDMEALWNYVMAGCKHYCAQEIPIIISEAPLNPKAHREKTTQIMFESFGTPGMYMANQAVLSLYATGRTDGIVLESGENVTYAVPIYEGHAMQHCIERLDIAGNTITEYLAKKLNESTNSSQFDTPGGRDVARQIKKNLCYVGLDFDQEMNKELEPVKSEYELLDGSKISVTVNKERIRCTELLFKPSMIGMEVQGIDRMINTSINKTDIYIHKYLYNNIVLSGGNTLLKGLDERILQELQNMAPSKYVVKVKAPTDMNNCWRGGAILSSLSTFAKMLISKVSCHEFL